MEKLSSERELLFQKARDELQSPAQVYRLGDRFNGLPLHLQLITMLDVSGVPGSHYGVRNVFVPIIHLLESKYAPGRSNIVVTPETAILIEPSTGNGWVAFSNAAEMLGYEHKVIMPDGLPEPRYHHPEERQVEIIKTPKEEYAVGMPKELHTLISQNKERLAKGQKIYVCPNHAVNRADITVETMYALPRQLIASLSDQNEKLIAAVSFGNGSSACSIGEEIKRVNPNSKLVTSESIAYGGGYDWYARLRRLPSYKELFGIDPGHPDLMARFTAFGTNAPIGIDMPLHKRAIESDLIDEYVLFTDDEVLGAYRALDPQTDHLENAIRLVNYHQLPKVLIDTYGNSTLANIAIASRYTGDTERVVAMAYDGRQNYS